MHAHLRPRGLKYVQKIFAESHQVLFLNSLYNFVATVAKAPVCQISYFYRVAGSNPGAAPKNAFNFFLNRLFHIFFFAFAFLIPKGMLTNNVDPQKGGEANYASFRKDLAHCAYVCIDWVIGRLLKKKQMSIQKGASNSFRSF